MSERPSLEPIQVPPDNHEQGLGIELASAELDRFITNPGLVGLENLFGAAPDAGPTERFRALQVVSTGWDFRKGATRQEVDWQNVGGDEISDPSSKTSRAIFEAADSLGQVRSGELRNRKPTCLTILGGANKAPLDRTRFGLEAVDDCDVLVYLGSLRQLTEKEAGVVAKAGYAPGASTEFDLGAGALKTLTDARFDRQYLARQEGEASWQQYSFEYKGRTKIGIILGTPVMIGDRKARSHDRYQGFVDQMGLAEKPGATVAQITTALYTPGQQLIGVTELSLAHGIPVETIGHSAEYSGADRKAAQLLAEDKLALDKALVLEQAIAAARAT